MKKLLLLLCSSVATISFADSFAINQFETGKLVKSGSHTAQENELHSNMCKQYGAVDVTDLSDIQLASGTKDAVICLSSNPVDMTATAGLINTVQVSSLSTSAPSASLPFAPYWIKGSASYANGHVGSGLAMSVGVPADNCGATGGSAIPVTTGVAYIQVTCSYPSGKGSHQSYMQASLEGANSTSYGTITLY